MIPHLFQTDPHRPSHCTCGQWRDDRCHEFEQHEFQPTPGLPSYFCMCGQLRTDPVHRGYARPEERD